MATCSTLGHLLGGGFLGVTGARLSHQIPSSMLATVPMMKREKRQFTGSRVLAPFSASSGQSCVWSNESLPGAPSTYRRICICENLRHHHSHMRLQDIYIYICMHAY